MLHHQRRWPGPHRKLHDDDSALRSYPDQRSCPGPCTVRPSRELLAVGDEAGRPSRCSALTGEAEPRRVRGPRRVEGVAIDEPASVARRCRSARAAVVAVRLAHAAPDGARRAPDSCSASSWPSNTMSQRMNQRHDPATASAPAGEPSASRTTSACPCPIASPRHGSADQRLLRLHQFCIHIQSTEAAGVSGSGAWTPAARRPHRRRAEGTTSRSPPKAWSPFSVGLGRRPAAISDPSRQVADSFAGLWSTMSQQIFTANRHHLVDAAG